MVLTESLSNGLHSTPSALDALVALSQDQGGSSQGSSPNLMLPKASTCSTCGTGSKSAPEPTQYVYALGKVEWRTPDQSITHELMQALGTPDLNGGYELAKLLLPENRYLARRLVWVLVIQGQDTFYLKPNEPSELKLLMEAAASEYSLVVGTGNSPADTANLPTVWFNQLYYFNLDGLFQDLSSHLDTAALNGQSQAVIEIYQDLFERIIYTANNAGHQPQFRAMNYLAVRYPAIYGETTKIIQKRNLKLIGIEVHHSELNHVRKVENVIFVFKDGQTHIQELYSVSVDVTGEFPFLVKPFSRYNKLKSCSCGG